MSGSGPRARPPVVADGVGRIESTSTAAIGFTSTDSIPNHSPAPFTADRRHSESDCEIVTSSEIGESFEITPPIANPERVN